MSLQHVDWVEITAKQMEKVGNTDIETWGKIWVESYQKVFKKQFTLTAEKGCPRKAAYGLWILGQLACSKRILTEPLNDENIINILNGLGKNVAYAVISILVINKYGKQHTKDWLWEKVSKDFLRITGQTSAETDQGPLEIVLSLAEHSRLK